MHTIEINTIKQAQVIIFQKACAFLKSIKKKEIPINFIAESIKIQIAVCNPSELEMMATLIVSPIKINKVIVVLFILKEQIYNWEQ